jgi:hypothetical protein
MLVNAVGIDDVLKGLSFIDQDMYAKIRHNITPAMHGVEQKAKGFVPSDGSVLSGWAKGATSNVTYRPFPRFSSSQAKGGIGYKEGQNRMFKNGFKVENYVYNISAAGRIYETAGRLNSQGRAPVMNTTLKELGGIHGYESGKKGKNRSTKGYNSNNPFAGYQFVNALEPVTKQPKIKGQRSGGRKTAGRLIYKAWAQDSQKVYNLIIEAINNSAITFNKNTEIKKAA